MRLVRRAGVTALALLATGSFAGGVAAQGGGARSGFWIEAGAGTGLVRSACSACRTVTVAYGTANHLRVGGALSPRVMLGLEVFGLRSSELVLREGAPPVDAETGSLSPIVIWYVGRSGFFLMGGVGLARGTYTVESPAGPATTERTGSAISFGLGFDIRIAERLALTASLGSRATAGFDVPVDAEPVRDVIATVYEAGVGLTLR